MQAHHQRDTVHESIDSNVSYALRPVTPATTQAVPVRQGGKLSLVRS
jgi:hypothetical protein